MKKSHRRKLAAFAAGFSLLASAALGFYLAETVFEGTGSAKAGEPTPTVEEAAVTFASGLTPGDHEPLTVETKKATSTIVNVKHMVFNVTTSASGCLPAWFVVGASNAEGTSLLGDLGEGHAIGLGSRMFEDFTLTFTEEASVNQTACSGAEIHVHVKASTA